MSAKRIRHIPDVARPGRTYCGRVWQRPYVGHPRLAAQGQTQMCLAVIDIDRDCIEDAECRACQRSDDRRTRETFERETKALLGVE